MTSSIRCINIVITSHDYTGPSTVVLIVVGVEVLLGADRRYMYSYLAVL